ncbi:spore coat associated protein CotJA [Sporomusa malonica]|uniref:Spore coat associated protein JA (CotJA) n=1 Tax=Sporomusa malonica TaxID=112901 RepID=A0A1W2EHH9_9FIRM|nr:spore coat associated protein CotJA [Sporomusa malonica]SMD09159.1 Spore coat associated protein JA (CotJA) [Sporomusa malonica]
MRKKTRSPMYVKPGKNKVMEMKDDLHDMDDMCEMEMDDMDDMDDMCEMEDEMDDMPANKQCYGKHMGGMKGMDKNMCDKMPECILLAHAYVPWQTYEKAFTPPEALMKGTLFPELWGVYPIPK